MIDIMQVEIADLVIHPLLDSIPELPMNCAERKALLASVETDGIHQPLLIQGMRVLDGRHRLWAAKKAGLTHVPCIDMEGDPATIIVDSLTQRRHYSKSALALAAAPLIDQYYLAGIDRRLENIKNPNVSRMCTSAQSGATRDVLGSRLGLSPRLIGQAREVLQLLEEMGDWMKDGTEMTIREWVNKVVFVGEDSGTGDYRPMGLGNVIKGLKGKKMGASPDKDETLNRRQMADVQILEHLIRINSHWNRWGELDVYQKTAVFEHVPNIVTEWPEDFRRVLLGELVKLNA
jgi:hypothetical protein